MEGWLRKKKTGESYKLFTDWTKRWFTFNLKTKQLEYSKNKRGFPNAVYPFDSIKYYNFTAGKGSGKWQFRFDIKLSNGEVRILYAKTHQEYLKWEDAFKTIARPLSEEVDELKR